uniref:Uncharacterized protein n=1 Tax=Stomoxys calcitrans TaxID=35570 RepID=A0A1I8PPN0_STOCA
MAGSSNFIAMNLSRNFEFVWPKLKELNEFAGSDGTKEKVLAMLVLGFGSFLFGMLPAIVSERNRQRFPLAKSLMLCFGSGILLATSLIHILPEVRKQMNSAWAEISLCGGFLLIYCIEELVHFFIGDHGEHSDSHSCNSAVASVSYGALDRESDPLIHDPGAFDPTINQNYSQDTEESHAHSRATQNSQSMSTTIGLFVALSIHSAIEGLAIGVQNTPSKVLFLLGAVACHKFVMGFCLGLLSSSEANIKVQFLSITVFALGTVCGISLGMLLIDIPLSLLIIVQGLAGGTLLYVAVCEVIPREKALWHKNSRHKIAGIVQTLAVALGFLTMTVINFYFDDDKA